MPWEDLADEVRRLGADPADDRLMSEALVAWEGLLSGPARRTAVTG
ncbi:MAG: hypothetical protein RLN63_08835 [Miltoncostaeaceae bacterium]